MSERFVWGKKIYLAMRWATRDNFSTLKLVQSLHKSCKVPVTEVYRIDKYSLVRHALGFHVQQVPDSNTPKDLEPDYVDLA